MHDVAPPAAFPRLASDALLLGCGYLGRAMLPGLAGARYALTRGSARHVALDAAGVRCLAGDLAAPDLAPRLAPFIAGFRGAVFVLAPPSAWPEAEVVAAFARLLDVLAGVAVTRGVLVSSSAVYGDAGGATVVAASPPDACAPRSRKLLAIEQAWMRAGFDAYVVRLAGLYGPGRVIGLDSLRRGVALGGDGEHWLNVLHVEDAARAVLATAIAPAPLRHALISDGAPLARREYYATVAALVGAPPPVFGGAGRRHGGSRRCDPGASWAALGLAPRWPQARGGVAQALGLTGR